MTQKSKIIKEKNKRNELKKQNNKREKRNK